jgi:hypothetical protein
MLFFVPITKFLGARVAIFLFLVYRNSAACTRPAGKRGKTPAVTPRVTPCGLSARRAGAGRYGIRASTPARYGSVYTFPSGLWLGSGQPVGYLSFSLRRSAPLLSLLSLARTGPPETRNQTYPERKENIFISHFFPHKKERETILQGRPRRNRPLHRQRAGDSVEPLSPRRRGRREGSSGSGSQQKKDNGGLLEPLGRSF